MLTTIFIIGNSRSGTKMIGNILNNSEQVFTIESEIHFFEELCAKDEIFSPISEKEAIVVLSKLLSTEQNGYLNRKKYDHDVLQGFTQIANEIYSKYKPKNWASVYAAFISYLSEKNQISFICETTPRNQFFIKDIAAIFNNHKFIYMYRDPRAVLFSQKKKWKSNLKKGRSLEIIRTIINYHPITTSLIWNTSIKKFLKYQDRVFSLQYENFINEPKAELKRLTDYLGIDFNDNLLSIEKTNSSLVTFKKKGIYSNSLYAWKENLSSAEIFINQLITKKYFNVLGYEYYKKNVPNILLVFLYIIYFPVHLFLVFLFNVGRYKNIFSSLLNRYK